MTKKTKYKNFLFLFSTFKSKICGFKIYNNISKNK